MIGKKDVAVLVVILVLAGIGFCFMSLALRGEAPGRCRLDRIKPPSWHCPVRR